MWRTIYAFWDGKQYEYFKNGQRRTSKAASWRVRSVHNIILPIGRVLMGKLLQQQPGWEVELTNVNYDQLVMAEASREFMEHLYYKLGIQGVSQEALWWAVHTGTGLFKRSWDGLKSLPSVRALCPLDFFPCPRASSLADCRHYVITHKYTEAELEKKWPKASKLLKESVSGDDTHVEEYKREFRDHQSSNTGGLITVLEYEEAPNEKHPQGYRCLLAGDVVLEESDLEHRLPEPGEGEEDTRPSYTRTQHYTVHMVRYNESAMRFWGNGFARDILGIQREYNRCWSQATELRNLHCQPLWLVPNGSIPENVKLSRPDTKVPYNRQKGVPQRIDPVPIPDSIEMHARALLQSAQDITGVHEVSMGKQESGVVSGRAMNILEDNGKLQLSAATSSLESCLTDLGTGLLEDYQIWGDEEYTYAVFGPGKVAETRELHKGSLITGMRVRAGSMAYRHPSVEIQRAGEQFAMGAFGPVDDPETRMRFQKALGVAGMTEFDGDQTLDRTKAREENEFLRNPEPNLHGAVKVSWLDEHLCHIDEHRRAMQSSTARNDPEFSSRLELHIAEHYSQLQAQANGLPVHEQAKGVTLEELQAQLQPVQESTPMPPTEPEMMQETAGLSGGTPELNGATVAPGATETILEGM